MIEEELKNVFRDFNDSIPEAHDFTISGSEIKITPVDSSLSVEELNEIYNKVRGKLFKNGISIKRNDLYGTTDETVGLSLEVDFMSRVDLILNIVLKSNGTYDRYESNDMFYLGTMTDLELRKKLFEVIENESKKENR